MDVGRILCRSDDVPLCGRQVPSHVVTTEELDLHPASPAVNGISRDAAVLHELFDWQHLAVTFDVRIDFRTVHLLFAHDELLG